MPPILLLEGHAENAWVGVRRPKARLGKIKLGVASLSWGQLNMHHWYGTLIGRQSLRRQLIVIGGSC